MNKTILWVLSGLILLVSCQAQAYVGPGAALTLIGVLFGWIAAVVTAIGMVLIWPFYKLYQWWRNKRAVKLDNNHQQQNHQ